jgi:hypothetical protein
LHAALAALPGDTEIAKIASVLSSAPSWLLLDSFVLGIELPKRYPAPEFGTDGLFEALESWPDLPSGTIGAGHPMPKFDPMRTLSPDESTDMLRLFVRGDENWSRRDRHRYYELMDKVDRAGTASD